MTSGKPQNPPQTPAQTHARLAMHHRQREEYPEALREIEAAIALAPELSEYRKAHIAILGCLVETFLNASQFAEAITYGERLVSLDPRNYGAQLHLGLALAGENRWEAALASYGRAIDINPAFPHAFLNRSTALMYLNRLDEALSDCRKICSLDPDNRPALGNASMVLQKMRRMDEALACLDRVLALRPDDTDALVGMAEIHLLTGDFTQGWRYYECRPWHKEWRLKRGLQFPEWTGDTPLAGKTILIHAEQGLGDAIQFCRYVKKVAALGAKVIFEVGKPLYNLMFDLEGVHTLLPHNLPSPPVDCQCAMMSLPFIFGTTLATIPAEIPYLFADPEKSARWRERLGPKKRLRVGLVAAIGFRPHNKADFVSRGIPFPLLARVNLPEVDFYSLQKGEPMESEMPSLQAQHWRGENFFNFAGELRDFSDTAALIENLDLVISVDTSVAHLAGAMGKPVWIPLKYDADWRWLMERDDSPWYPTARLFRQTKIGVWDDVAENLRAALESWVEAPSPPTNVAKTAAPSPQPGTTAMNSLPLPRPLAFILAATQHGAMLVNRHDYAETADEHYGVGCQLLETSTYDPTDVSLALQLIKNRREHFGDGVVAIDGGANIGVHTIEWAKFMHGWGEVLAFEAQERIFYALAGNITLNNCFNAYARWAAIGAEDGEILVPRPDYLKPASFGSLEIRKTPNTEFIGQAIDYSPENAQAVTLLRIDSLALTRLDFLKIDIEGMEMEALQGANQTISAHRPLIFVEKIKSNEADLRGFLAAHAYRIFDMGMNLLAVHESDPLAGEIKSTT